MVAVSTYSWEELASPGFADPQRAAFRAAVASVAAQASAKLPESNGRIESGGQIGAGRDVTARRRRHRGGDRQRRDAQKSYEVRPGFCSCPDFDHAPHNLCKHRLAAAIPRRATTLLTTGEAPEADVEPLEAPPAAEPAPAIPAQYIVVIQGKNFVLFAGLLALAHSRGLTSLTADWTYNDAALSLAQSHRRVPLRHFTSAAMPARTTSPRRSARIFGGWR